MTRKLEKLITKTCEQDCEKAFVHIIDDMKRTFPPLSYGRRRALKYFLSIILVTTVFSLFNLASRPGHSSFAGIFEKKSTTPLIVIVTPTYRRTTRLADMTRMANTLMHVNDIHWIVIEDGPSTYPHMTRLLDRTGIPYTYMAHSTISGYPKKGWHQRNMAMQYIREHPDEILKDHPSGVMYFGDDDNAYDLRLFDNYIRKVKVIGMWAVGLVGGIPVESLKVENGKVVGFNVKWNKKRKFAVDMGGFAINLERVFNTTAKFPPGCKRGMGAPETCLLEDMGFQKEDIEPFGMEGGTYKEVLIWHTKTKTPSFDPRKTDSNGYLVEYGRNDTVGVPVKTKHSSGKKD